MVKKCNKINKLVSMMKKEFEKEPYEVPKLVYFSANVELGFAGSIPVTPGEGDEWDEEW